ncbi:MAG: peptidylprolyl isomerase [Bacteroidetes bacterium GWF2_42_66]|nr:MAG: peptidylprolyl isomerase [Bacteroidetes bacterium GWA2_42_15]OFX99206.1 MAG: peptidylprolyl isomerase [Bacteroidetes bacterium GWE2_42_39]OFY40602.1 MAG: peptidylprolyl isomerase [Bacteroidetes bacterium GWF2_42_66]HBL74556.1 peptidylprolyl isomerase [Prolixibacteraceae bacterium]HCR88996.1 peptidylprolyl isomerase [Prolixibacteraceae bacterium]
MSDFNSQLGKFSYSLGLSIGSNLIQSGVKSLDPQNFLDGLQDVFNGQEPKLTDNEANRILQDFMAEQQAGEGKANMEEGQQFLTENRKKEGIEETASGLQFTILKTGDGELPTLTDQVKCHYHGTLIDGTVFDSSVERGQPAVFPVNGVIQGWVEALQMMPVGSKWRLFVPSGLAYGNRGAGGSIGPNSTLIFDVELLEII